MGDKKLRFHVVYASGEDPQYPASELNTHSSKSRGWATARFCPFPQELGFGFDDGVVTLSQIQVLSHQFKIAKRIELYVGFGDDYMHAEFKRLGYMSLESNERSEYKARELKSVYVNAEAQFVRLVIHECYSNPHNVTKQVCIVAVNFKGGVGSGPGLSLPPVAPQRASGASSVAKGPGVHDLALDMRMDPETAATIRAVADMKDKAAADEDYETAKALKLVLNDLMKLGSQISQLIDDKNQAVDNEDYDRASALRDDINAVRASIKRRIAMAGLGGRGGGGGGYQPPEPTPPVRGGSYPPEPTYYEDGRAPARRGGVGGGGRSTETDYGYAQPSPAQLVDRGFPANKPGWRDADVDDRQLPVAHMAAHDDNDLDQTIGGKADLSPDAGAVGRFPKHTVSGEKPFPGDRPIQPARNADKLYSDASGAAPSDAGGGGGEYDEGDAFGGAAGGEEADPSALAGVDNASSLPAPAQLKPALAKEFAVEISLFGEYVMRCFHSVQWALREAALKKIELELSSYECTKSNLLSSIAKLLAFVFTKEKNAQVIMVARELLPKALAECAGDVRKQDIIATLEPVLAGLIEKLGETNTRIRDAAIDALMHMADDEALGHSAIGGAVLKKLNQKQMSAWRPIKTRLEVAYMLVHGFGLTSSGPLSEDSILSFLGAANAYSHPNGEVRDAAKALIVLLHSMRGDSVMKHIAGVLRPQQLKEYQAAFDKGAPADPPTLVKDKSSAPLSKEPERAAPPAAKKPAASGGGGGKTAAPAAKGKAAAPAPAPAKTRAPVEEEDEYDDEEGLCQFCEGCGPGATEEQLDLHYWQECPMLMGCSECNQIIEISGLNEHLLTECERRTAFRRCPRCKEAVAAKEYDAHVAAKACGATPAGATRCPLCHKQLSANGEAWLEHLIDDGCPSNPRA